MREIKFEVTFKVDDAYNIDSIDIESEKLDDVKKGYWKNTGNTRSIQLNGSTGETKLKKLIEALKVMEVK